VRSVTTSRASLRTRTDSTAARSSSEPAGNVTAVSVVGNGMVAIVPPAESITRCHLGRTGVDKSCTPAARRGGLRPNRTATPGAAEEGYGRYGDGHPALPRRDIGCGSGLDPRRGGRTSRGRTLTGRQRRDRRSHRRPAVRAALRHPGPPPHRRGPAELLRRAPFRASRPGPVPGFPTARRRCPSGMPRRRAGIGVGRTASRRRCARRARNCRRVPSKPGAKHQPAASRCVERRADLLAVGFAGDDIPAALGLPSEACRLRRAGRGQE